MLKNVYPEHLSQSLLNALDVAEKVFTSLAMTSTKASMIALDECPNMPKEPRLTSPGTALGH